MSMGEETRMAPWSVVSIILKPLSRRSRSVRSIMPSVNHSRVTLRYALSSVMRSRRVRLSVVACERASTKLNTSALSWLLA